MNFRNFLSLLLCFLMIFTFSSCIKNISYPIESSKSPSCSCVGTPKTVSLRKTPKRSHPNTLWRNFFCAIGIVLASAIVSVLAYVFTPPVGFCARQANNREDFQEAGDNSFGTETDSSNSTKDGKWNFFETPEATPLPSDFCK